MMVIHRMASGRTPVLVKCSTRHEWALNPYKRPGTRGIEGLFNRGGEDLNGTSPGPNNGPKRIALSGNCGLFPRLRQGQRVTAQFGIVKLLAFAVSLH